MKKLIILITGLLLFSGHQLGWASKNITIVYTNSLNGKLDYCHCKEDPNGGLVKRATVFFELRKQYPSAMFFDSGDFMLYEKDDILLKYLVPGMEHLSYDSISCGDQEFMNGINPVVSFSKKLPILCNNLEVRYNSVFTNPFRRTAVIEKNGIRIGVIGSMGEGTFRFYKKEITTNIRVLDQIAEIRKDVAMMKKNNPDMVILLSHSGYERDKKIAEKVKGIDVIVGGHTQNFLQKPYYNGKTIIVQAGMNGAHIGILEIVREKGKTIKFTNKFILPDDKHPADDPYIRKLLNDYGIESKKAAKDIKFD